MYLGIRTRVAHWLLADCLFCLVFALTSIETRDKQLNINDTIHLKLHIHPRRHWHKRARARTRTEQAASTGKPTGSCATISAELHSNTQQRRNTALENCLDSSGIKRHRLHLLPAGSRRWCPARIAGRESEEATINSWHRAADPSRQCCCGVAGVRASLAVSRAPGTWHMAATGVRVSHTLSTTKPRALGGAQRRRATRR